MPTRKSMNHPFHDQNSHEYLFHLNADKAQARERVFNLYIIIRLVHGVRVFL